MTVDFDFDLSARRLFFRCDFEHERENEKKQVNRLCSYKFQKKVLNIQYYDVQIVSRQLHDRGFNDVIMIMILALIS